MILPVELVVRGSTRRRPRATSSGPLSMYSLRNVRIASNTLSFISGHVSECPHAVAATAASIPVGFSNSSMW